MITLWLEMIATAAAPPSRSAVEIESLWDFIVKGGPMMIPIGLCSLIAFAVFVERLISLRRERVLPSGFMGELRNLLDAGDATGAARLCDKRPSPVARLLGAGVRRLERPVDQVEKVLSETGEREVMRMRKFLRALSVIASLTPLMGLLGTIFGMIRAFQTVAASAEALGKTEMLAGGIYEAMITTAAGLCVAIPVIIMYHWVAAKVDRRALDLDHAAVDFVDRWCGRAAARAGATPSASVRIAAQ